MENTPHENPGLLTVPQAAEEAQVSTDAIRKAIYRKNLPSIQVYGRLLIKREDFDAWKAGDRKRGRPTKDKSAQSGTEESGEQG